MTQTATRALPANLQGGLIVSCQALADEPLHSSFIMGRMALAAAQGGAVGIRANSAEDIRAIRENVNLPIIGIIKRDYPDSEVFITATMREVDELMTVAPEIIAIDARDAPRPGGQTLAAFVAAIRAAYPEVLLMADCASLAEMQHADALGFDFIGTTLFAPRSRPSSGRLSPRATSIPRKKCGVCWRWGFTAS